MIVVLNVLCGLIQAAQEKHPLTKFVQGSCYKADVPRPPVAQCNLQDLKMIGDAPLQKPQGVSVAQFYRNTFAEQEAIILGTACKIAGIDWSDLDGKKEAGRLDRLREKPKIICAEPEVVAFVKNLLLRENSTDIFEVGLRIDMPQRKSLSLWGIADNNKDTYLYKEFGADTEEGQEREMYRLLIWMECFKDAENFNFLCGLFGGGHGDFELEKIIDQYKVFANRRLNIEGYMRYKIGDKRPYLQELQRSLEEEKMLNTEQWRNECVAS